MLIYLLLVFFGWINIYAAIYSDDHNSILDVSQRYGMQLVWIGVSLFFAISLMLIDTKYYHIFAYPLFWFMIAVMLFVLFFGNETNGSKSWLKITNSIKIQPVEFMKVAAALAIARCLSSHNFNISSRRSLANIAMIITLPILIVVLQNETGSALVFLSLFIMLYREGFNKIIYILLGFIVLLGVLAFLLEPFTILLIIFTLCLVAQVVVNGNWQLTVRYVAAVSLLTLPLLLFMHPYWSLVVAITVSTPFVLVYAHRKMSNSTLVILATFFGAVAFTFFVDYAFDNILQLHQQKRILDLLGIEHDPKGWSYNVIQSKIAIGSGGLNGKGFLNGTQTRLSFVPEQDTDFIFCTVGEEWGFLGSMVVISLFGVLIYRLIRMGERQQEAFGRVYCYSVASILLFHFVINISMTIGIFPVVGIPLPFFSYGGSSLLAFTILLFIAIRLDSKQPELTE